MRSFILGVLCLLSPLVQAQQWQFESATRQTRLLELYTSEGCSSCPPAERYINALRRDGRLWQGLIPLAFHVDYWDYLGWRDPYGEPAHAQRQRQLARHNRSATVYTPGLFLNGAEWRSWRLSGGVPDGERQVGRLWLRLNGHELEAGFEPQMADGGEWVWHSALLGMGLQSKIAAGENRGRLARHDFVVLQHRQQGPGGRHWQTHVDYRFDAAPELALVVWLEAPGDPAPVQAVGGMLSR